MRWYRKRAAFIGGKADTKRVTVGIVPKENA
jgi:hypothetical protein